MECIRQFCDRACKGLGAALLIEGPSGVGKTSLLQDVIASSPGVHVVRVDGIEVETRMPSAGLSRLVGPGAPFAARSDSDALGTGLALLESLSRLGSELPVLIVADDAHWLDETTLEVLGVAARRVDGHPVALLLSARPGTSATRHMTGVDRLTLQDPGPGVQASHPSPPGIEVRLLGRFEVRTNGERVVLGEGLASTLLKIVALKGHVASEEAEEILWPDAAPGSGRVRMRNVVHRLRSVCGPVIERDGRTLRMGSGVQVDLNLFEESAIKAIASVDAGVPEGPELARAALSLYPGELLPVDRWADWTVIARERTERLYFALLDVVDIRSIPRQDARDALRAIERAIELDPHDEEPYVRGAKLLFDSGSPSLALSLARRAESAMTQIGAPISDDLTDLIEKLS